MKFKEISRQTKSEHSKSVIISVVVVVVAIQPRLGTGDTSFSHRGHPTGWPGHELF